MEKTVVQTINKYAIVINTHNRPISLFNQTVNHYRQKCGSMYYAGIMSHAFIIWGDVYKITPLSDAF